MSTHLSTHVVPLPAPDIIYRGFFASIAQRGLTQTTLGTLAVDNHWPIATLRREWPTIGHILSGFGKSITARMQDDVTIDGEAGKRDLYFELLMARLDALQPYKDGLIRFYRDLPTRPDLALVMLREAHQTVDSLISLTGDDWPMWQKPLKRLVLAGLYARLLHIWQQDDTADLSKSMKFLDTQLERLDGWAAKVPLATA